MFQCILAKSSIRPYPLQRVFISSLSPLSLCFIVPKLLLVLAAERFDSLWSVRAAKIRLNDVVGSAGKLYLLATAASAGVHLAYSVHALTDRACNDIIDKIEAIDGIVVGCVARERDAILDLVFARLAVPEDVLLGRNPRGEEEGNGPNGRSHIDRRSDL